MFSLGSKDTHLFFNGEEKQALFHWIFVLVLLVFFLYCSRMENSEPVAKSCPSCDERAVKRR